VFKGEFMFDRIIKLIGEEKFEKITKKNILLVGIGGVGGYVFESLMRSGIKHITIIDEDEFEITNLNRQIYATKKTISKEKVLVAKDRANEISNDILVTPIKKHLTKEDIDEKFLGSFDYVIDACDSVEVKIELIKKCKDLNIKLISCMGTANKTNAEVLEITKLKNTMNDPLAKRLRHVFSNTKKYLETVVVSSKELPKKQKELGTFCHVPMAAASLIVSFILNDIIKDN